MNPSTRLEEETESASFSVDEIHERLSSAATLSLTPHIDTREASKFWPARGGAYP